MKPTFIISLLWCLVLLGFKIKDLCAPSPSLLPPFPFKYLVHLDAPAWQEVAQPQHMSSYFWAETSCCTFLLPSVTSEVGGTSHLLSNWSTPTLSKNRDPSKSFLFQKETFWSLDCLIRAFLATGPHKTGPDCKSSNSHVETCTSGGENDKWGK